MGTSKFQIAKAKIKTLLDGLDTEVFKQVDISTVFGQGREEWSLPKTMTGPTFAKKLVEAKILNRFTFPFPARQEVRYAKPRVPMLKVLQSLKANAYYTHATAMKAHGLIDSSYPDVFINFEQPNHSRSNLPEQSRIDAAFKNNPRKTNNIIQYNDGKIMMLNGMYTGLLGVAEQLVHGLEKRPVSLRLTDLERTLIDITVRPYYGGGIDSVLLAYQRASDRVDGVKLAQYLVDLDYVYPFYQAVGWYMTKAGYSEDQMRGIKAQPLVRRFYLTHKMATPAFNDNWQIYVPSNLN